MITIPKGMRYQLVFSTVAASDLAYELIAIDGITAHESEVEETNWILNPKIESYVRQHVMVVYDTVCFRMFREDRVYFIVFDKREIL